MPASQKVRTISRRYRDGWALLPLRPCGSARRRRPSRRRPQSSRAPAGECGFRRGSSGMQPGPKGQKTGSPFLSFRKLLCVLAVECRSICSSSRSVRLSKRSSRPEYARFCQENWPREARDRAGPRCARLIVADAGGAFISLAHSAPACSLFCCLTSRGRRKQGKRR